MIAFWIGIVLLANSWLWGLGFFSPHNWALWASSIVVGVGLIAFASPARFVFSDSRRTRMLCLLALLPVAILAPWPYRMPAIVLFIGVAMSFVDTSPNRGTFPPSAMRWASGVTLAGIVLFAQAAAIFIYTSWTARSHELPRPLQQLLASIARFFNIDAGTDGLNVVLPTMRANHPLGATWELLLDPASLAFIISALVIAALVFRASPTVTPPVETKPKAKKPVIPSTGRQSALIDVLQNPLVRNAGAILLAAILWLPVRSALLMALFLNRAIRTDYDSPLNLMNQFWDPWPYLLLLIPLTLLVAYWIGPSPNVSNGSLASSSSTAAGWQIAAAPASAFGVVALLTLAACWDPVGSRKPGRLAFDEHHSKWEPTGRPFDTEWYGHLSGYNYACIYDYSSRFYDVSRITNAITDATLASLDVLILKVPTEPFQGPEVESILRFVRNGGGVLLVGEHTDVFNTGYHLNSVARHFGFTYRYDCLFGMESFFDQFYKPTLACHPAVQYIRGLDFATSCSIDTGKSKGRGVIVSTALKNSMADYHANNFYPQAVDIASMRYGAFVQLWSTRYGKGRVLAFTDSTIFSNFSAFEPGKPQILLGMLEWLNHRDSIGSPRFILLCLAAALAVFGIIKLRRQPVSAVTLVTAGALGWVATAQAISLVNQQQMPVPKAVRPYTRVVIDRTACEGPLSKNGFITGSTNGFGIFERWILRLGYFTERASGSEALTGDLAVLFYPTKHADAGYKKKLVEYVENGGKVLIVDSPKNTQSTAAELLQPFGLSVKALAGQGGALSVPSGWTAVPVDSANEISGGQPIVQLEGKPVASYIKRGKGTVVVVGFGSRFSDANMGVTGDVEPSEDLRKVFNLQFALLRAIIGNALPQ